MSIQLSPHSKKLLLQHSINKLTDEDGYVPREFFKFLLVNNQFLNTARLNHIYCVCISLGPDSNLPSFCLLKKLDSISTKVFNEKTENFPKLLKLLQPTLLSIGVYIYSGMDDALNRLVQAVKEIECKICLRLNGGGAYAIQLLNSWTSKVSHLFCNNSSSLSACAPLNLNYCLVDQVKKDELIPLMSRHTIRTLEILKYEAGDEEVEIIPNEVITNVDTLRISAEPLDLPGLFELFSKKWIQLETLEICHDSGADLEYFEEVLTYIDEVHQKIVILKELCPQWIRNLIIKFHPWFEICIDYRDDWVQQLKQHDMLKGCNYKEDDDGAHIFSSLFKDELVEIDIQVTIRI